MSPSKERLSRQLILFWAIILMASSSCSLYRQSPEYHPWKKTDWSSWDSFLCNLCVQHVLGELHALACRRSDLILCANQLTSNCTFSILTPTNWFFAPTNSPVNCTFSTVVFWWYCAIGVVAFALISFISFSAVGVVRTEGFVFLRMVHWLQA
jgi:hypothetical protein